MSKYVFTCTGIVGGGSNVDGINGANISKGDMSMVRFSTGGIFKFAVYWATTEASAQSLPGIVVPDANSGSLVWRKVKLFSTST